LRTFTNYTDTENTYTCTLSTIVTLHTKYTGFDYNATIKHSNLYILIFDLIGCSF